MRDRFDVLVVGAGPAGIAAAVTAADAGLRVGLVDDNPAAGGQIWRSGAHLPAQARQWLARLDASSVLRLQGWRVFDAPEPGALLAEQNGAAATANTGVPSDICAELSYKKLILATGARERFLPFPGWTLPGVMGAGGLDAMVRGGLPVSGKRVVIAGTGPLLLAVAAHVAARGAKIAVICDQASFSQLVALAIHVLGDPGKVWQGLQYRLTTRSAPYRTGCWPVAAHGDSRLRSVTLQQGTKKWDVDCDFLACGFHLVPNTELAALLGCRIVDGFVSTNDLLETSVPNVYCAGEPTSIGGVEIAILDGQIAGAVVSDRTSRAQQLVMRRKRRLGFVHALERASSLNPALRALATDETIVCRCEDVRFGALRICNSWRDAKLHLRCGMGPCQGRICGTATEVLFNWRAESVRPPIFPALVSSLAVAAEAAHQPESYASAGALSADSKETP